jgi:hypothetical protein
MAQDPNNIPSIDPANDGDLPGMLRQVFGKLMQGVDGMLPARVVAFNGDRNAPRVTVQPLVALLTTGNAQVSRAQIASLPVFQFGAGGFLMSFPLQPGDLGWIMASDRDISLFLQAYDVARPQTLRKHNFADAVFIPDVMHNYSIAVEDETNAVWQTADSDTRVALWPEFVKITATRGLGINVQPADNVIFDTASTTHASRPLPRMTQAQRDAIPSPTEGMGVWNLTTHAPSYFNGSVWS